MEATEFESIKDNIAQTLHANVISPALLGDLISDLTRIDKQATPTQQSAIQTILKENHSTIEATIQQTIKSTLANPEVKKFLGTIAMGTVYGVLPSIGFQALSILSGNMDLATAGTALIDVGVLSALDSFVRYISAQGGISPEMSSFNAGTLSTALQEFIGFVGNRPTTIPLLGPAGRPLIAGLRSLTLNLTTKEIDKSGGIPTLLQKINWNDLAMGPENQAVVSEHHSAYEFIRNNLSMIIQNQTVRSATATVVSYAIEGAVIGAVMHSLGIGFYNEITIPSALSNAMLRGALEGLYSFSQYGTQPTGIVQRLTGGLTSLSIQRYLQSGVGVGTLDITPLAVQQITVGAVTGIVRQAGGWANAFKGLYSTGKNALFGGN